MKLSTLILSATYLFCAGPAHAEIVKDSWFIKFRANEVHNERIVQPPLASNKGRVAFPLHNSGQTTSDVRERLALKGEVKYIFDSMNIDICSNFA